MQESDKVEEVDVSNKARVTGNIHAVIRYSNREVYSTFVFWFTSISNKNYLLPHEANKIIE